MSARAEAASSGALARLYCPPAQRAAFGALLEIEAEIRAALKPGLEHEVAHARLGWWQEECERLVQRQPQHPLTRRLLGACGAPGAAGLAGVSGFVDLARWDLAAATFGARRELTAYAQRWSTAFVAPLVQLALAGTASASALALGARLHELELLNGAASDARRGRLRLPLEALEAAGVSSQELQQERYGAALTALLREEHHAARAALGAAAAGLEPHAQRALPQLLVWCELAVAHSHRTGATLPRASSPGDHHGLFDGWRAWRAGRRALGGRFSLPAG